MGGRVQTPEYLAARDYCVRFYGVKSAAIIAKEVSEGVLGFPIKITKNSVIGYWARSKECHGKREQDALNKTLLAKREAKQRMDSPTHPPKKHKNGGRITAMFMPMITPIQAPPPPEPDPSAPARRFGDPWPMTATAVTLLKRENNQCAFPLWGYERLKRDQMFYCGAPVALGESYCARCKKRMYTPSYAKLRQIERDKNAGVAA